LVAHIDFSGIANCRTKFPLIFRGKFGIFRPILKYLFYCLFILFVYLFIYLFICCLFIYLIVYLFVCLFVCLGIFRRTPSNILRNLVGNHSPRHWQKQTSWHVALSRMSIVQPAVLPHVFRYILQGICLDQIALSGEEISISTHMLMYFSAYNAHILHYPQFRNLEPRE